MRRAFIVRPFWLKKEYDFNFDEVETQLISPALEQLQIHGRTTGEILSQGNIREDMFNRLLAADLVVADSSIPNANVFYELGIRHALQDRHTVLIRCRFPGVTSFFDIAPDRYMEYPREGFAENVDDLVRRITTTVAENRADSPVFLFLGDLRPQDRDRFVRAPSEFTEDVEVARKNGRDGDLDTYASELRTLDVPWALGGLLIVGEVQFTPRAWDAARDTWEAIRETSPRH
jgi:hypothetical protein